MYIYKMQQFFSYVYVCLCNRICMYVLFCVRTSIICMYDKRKEEKRVYVCMYVCICTPIHHTYTYTQPQEKSEEESARKSDDESLEEIRKRMAATKISESKQQQQTQRSSHDVKQMRNVPSAPRLSVRMMYAIMCVFV